MEDGLQFDVPWADIKTRLQERSEAAFNVAQAQGQDGKDPCHEGIRVAAERDATLFGLLSKYAPESGTAVMNRQQIADLFMAQPFYAQRAVSPMEDVAEASW